MATGRRDYTWGFLSEEASEGRYKEQFIKYFNTIVFPSETKVVYEYNIPTGKILAIYRVDISCDSGVDCRIITAVDLTTEIDRFFSGEHSIIFSDKSPRVLQAGQNFRVICYNLDIVNVQFIGLVNGLLMDVI